MQVLDSTQTWRLVIPRLPSPLLKPSTRRHWGEIRRAKMEDTQFAYGFALTTPRPKDPWDRVALRVTFVVAQQRRRDRDNWGAMCKGFIDALTPRGPNKAGIGLLADDDGETIRSMELVWEVDKARAPQTIIEVTPQRHETHREGA